ncbi:hypothetical protein [Halostella salina]|uniref:hypothetical protein n=1 Tax=Halostella salina TaxID=1547897 RepID=UPI000EF83A4E|nr:hypothetical protein [Halostella salina]
MILNSLSATAAVLVIGLTLSVLLPLAVVVVTVRGYRRGDGSRRALRLAAGIVLVTAVPTLLRLAFGSVLPGGTWSALVIRLTELVGLLVVIGVMHGE